MKIFAQSVKVWVFLFSTSLFLLSSCDEKKPADDKGKQRSALEDNRVQNENCGPASIEELKENCDRIPEWLLSAKTSEESLSISDRGVVIWHKGTWKSGTWEDGIWDGGIWEDGTWEDGIWEGGTWEDGFWWNGTWKDGTWETGSWHGGTWNNGTWENGTWFRGTWWNGTWKYGGWLDGTWNNGTWKGGFWKGQRKGSDFDPKTAN